jgi:ribosomal protein S18 acetylase RimI-like enzyme
MTSREQARMPRLVALRELGAADLQPLLEEEKARWLALLHWDFTASAELVLRYAAMQALEGCALLDGDDVAGYVYWVSEEHKGLIGDLYLRSAWRTPASENALLGAALGEIRRNPWVRRVEAQLMHLGARSSQVAPAGLRPHAYPRHFMLAPLSGIHSLRQWNADPGLRFEPWAMRWLDESSELIARVYAGHVDSEINDQYHSARGARRFLQNIVQYPGCGRFAADASWVAVDPAGRAQGLCLSSRVAAGAGHIAQICLAPEFQGRGAGYELLRRGMAALASTGAEEVSLTATAANQHAIRLYERFGFRAVYQFEALVWDRLWP